MNGLLNAICPIKGKRKPSFFDWDPHPPAIVPDSKLKRCVEDHRMDVQVKMPIDMRKAQASRAELLELCGEFFSQLAPRARGKKILQSGASRIVREVSLL